MKKLLLITTGGTIACVPSDEGLVPALGARELLDALDMDEFHIDCKDLFNMDSSNIQPEEWLKIAGKIYRHISEYDGVVVTHGTDTMAYTASMLTFLLQNVNIPIILTGSQYPMVYPDSDGRKNLKNAIIAANAMEGGVYVCFGDSVMLGCRAVKTRTTSLNAFESINYPYVGTVANGRYIQLHSPKRGEFRHYGMLESRVALIKLIPGTSTEVIESMLSCDIKGVVVEAFGLGGVHNVRRDHAESIKKLMQHGIPVILTSQCLYEASSPELYQVSKPLREAGVISAHDMTTEAAVTKLMWVLDNAKDVLSVRQMMQTNYCGEIIDGLEP